MRTYMGIAHAPIGGSGAREWAVTVLDERGSQPLPLHVDQSKGHRAHSPDGHSWGYGGSGPAQLAYDLLWDVLDEEPRPALYQAFKWAFVARWPQDGDWRMTENEIRTWLAEQEVTS